MFSVEIDAILFDCDGVIVDSMDAAAIAWNQWAQKWLPGFDFHRDVQHGRRLSDFVAENIPAESVTSAGAELHALEMEHASDVHAISGAGELLRGLTPGRWAVVTSGVREIATARINAAGLPMPDVLVTAEDVRSGKPSPEPYALGASLLGVAPDRCAVFEDAAAGVAAAHAAGVTVVVGVGGALDRATVSVAVPDLRGITHDGVRLLIPT